MKKFWMFDWSIEEGDKKLKGHGLATADDGRFPEKDAKKQVITFFGNQCGIPPSMADDQETQNLIHISNYFSVDFDCNVPWLKVRQDEKH